MFEEESKKFLMCNRCRCSMPIYVSNVIDNNNYCDLCSTVVMAHKNYIPKESLGAGCTSEITKA